MKQQATSIKFDASQASPPFTSVYRTSTTTALVDRNRSHYHPSTLEVCALIQGHQDWLVAEEPHVLRPGDVLVIPEGVVHGSVDSNLQPCELVAAHIALEMLPDRLREPAQKLTTIRTRNASITGLLQQVVCQHEVGGEFLPEVASALGVLVITSLLSLGLEDEELKDSRLVRKAQEAMTAGHGVRPTMDEVARQLGVSSVWLTKLFVRETGSSPGDWARAARFSQAKKMLESGRFTTTKIAFELGYSSGQSFATAFRQESGMTPSEYKELHRASLSHRTPTVYRVDTREVW